MSDEPLEILIRVLKKYLEKRGEQIISLSKASGQSKIKISFRGLYKNMGSVESKYDRFEKIIREIISDGKQLEKLREKGIVINIRGKYIEIPISFLEELMRNN